MGVKGLTSCLKECNLLPTYDEETGEMFSSIPYQDFQRGSTFAIDGSGLVFHLFRKAYMRHYAHVMANKTSYEDDVHVIMHLLPSMLHLKDIHNETCRFVNLLRCEHGIHLDIYFDGRKRSVVKVTIEKEEAHVETGHNESFLMEQFEFVDEIDEHNDMNQIVDPHNLQEEVVFDIVDDMVDTKEDKDREPSIESVSEEESAIAEEEEEEIETYDFFFKANTSAERYTARYENEKALQKFFKKRILPNSFRSKRSRRGNSISIPSASTFLDEFPTPTLLFQEVHHTLLNLSKENFSEAGHLNVIDCESEADRDVALASALDVSNQIYAVAQDSDFLIFGFKKNHPLSSLGDLHVQYVPLNALVIDEEQVCGCIITRQKIAKEFNIEEDLLVEAAILLGNDYTKFINDPHLRKFVNFFQDTDIIQEKRKNTNLQVRDVIDALSELSRYQVESESYEQQMSIEFSRKLYQLEEVKEYIVDENADHLDQSYESSGDCTSIILDNHVKALDETLIQQSIRSDEDDSLCVKSQIMTTFNNMQIYEEDLNDLLRSTLDMMMESNDIRGNARNIPAKLSWHEYMLSEVFQKSIQRVLKRNRGKKFVDGNHFLLPSNIFDHQYFYHALIETSESLQLTVDTSLDDVTSSTPKLEVKRKVLPIDAHRDEILRSIEENRVTIIQGETGCGKSSRVPVMLLESLQQGESVIQPKLFVSQPRRIAAKSLTERVRDTEPKLKKFFGLRMGHGIREYHSDDTCCFFCTTGYLVRYLANNLDSFRDVTHLIIDEVHERSIENDILCLLAKRLLDSNPSVKLVLMSATVAANRYSSYFGVTKAPIFVGVRCHAIHEFFSDDIALKLNFEKQERDMLRSITDKCLKSKCTSAPNRQYMTSLYEISVQIVLEVGVPGTSILVFVPGMHDIIEITDLFDTIVSDIHYRVIPIHSDIPFEDQMNAFDTAQRNEVKVIVATNAAESSITLPDVNFVICFGLCKAITYNELSHRQMLETTWISRASAVQRAGRTGRCREGHVYRLYPRYAFENYFITFDEGEILRSPLDSVILNMKTIIESEENISQLLMECIEPPRVEQIQNSFTSLYQRNLISDACENFQITSLGRFVATLGVDHAIASLVGLGIRFNLLPETIEMAAILSFTKSPWLLPNAILQEPEVFNDILSKVYVSKSIFDGELYSEIFSTMNLIFDFEMCNSRRAFCKEYSISYTRITRILSIRNNLRERIGNYLKLDSHALIMNNPPRTMSPSKLMALRIFKVWMFQDGIVQLPAHNIKGKNKAGNEVNIKGDIINEFHLEQILDKDMHKYSLKTERNSTYYASFEPVKIDYEESYLDMKAFRERLLSFSNEQNIGIVSSRVEDSLRIFVSEKVSDELLSHFMCSQYEDKGVIICVQNHGKKSGRCDCWSIQDSKDKHSNEKDVVKWREYSTARGSQKKFQKMREVLKSSPMLHSCSAFAIDIHNTAGGTVKIYAYRSELDLVGKVDMISLFRTPNVNLQKSNDSNNVQQSILFEVENNLLNDSVAFKKKCPVIINDPEGKRICLALATARRSKPSILLYNDVAENETDASYYSEIAFQQKYDTKRWIWKETGSPAIVDVDSITGTVAVQTCDVYACCANILELKSGYARVEGMTIMPSKEFVDLAEECICYPLSMEDSVDEVPAAKVFYDNFKDILLEEDLQYSSTAEELLCAAFHSYDMKPWSHPNRNATKCNENEQKEPKISLGADICNSLAKDMLPSCFLADFGNG